MLRTKCMYVLSLTLLFHHFPLFGADIWNVVLLKNVFSHFNFRDSCFPTRNIIQHLLLFPLQLSFRSFSSRKHENIAFALRACLFYECSPNIARFTILSGWSRIYGPSTCIWGFQKVDLGRRESIIGRFLRITPLSCFSWKKSFSPEGTEGQGNKTKN